MTRTRLLLLSLAACVAAPVVLAQGAPGGRTSGVADSLDANYVPIGFGSLRQDDITVRVTLTGGLQVRAIPLDERIIRLLSPDSYNVMASVKESKRNAVDSISARAHLQSYSLWYVTFYGVEQGEARFSPQELIIRNVGRDFRPVDVLPLSAGFGENRVKQREVQHALYVFDGQLDVLQPLTAQMENTPSSTDWESVLHRVEQERSLVRSRAASAVKKRGASNPGTR